MCSHIHSPGADTKSDDDLWDSEEDGIQGDLERERDARHNQFHNVGGYSINKRSRSIKAACDATAGCMALTCCPWVQVGYRDGMDVGKEKTLQHGFDIGEQAHRTRGLGFRYTEISSSIDASLLFSLQLLAVLRPLCYNCAMCLEPERKISAIMPAGFKEGTQAGFEWGTVRAAVKTLEILCGQVEGTSKMQGQVRGPILNPHTASLFTLKIDQPPP